MHKMYLIKANLGDITLDNFDEHKELLEYLTNFFDMQGAEYDAEWKSALKKAPPPCLPPMMWKI